MMTKDTLDTLIDSIQQVLKSDGRVMTAWIYGSTSTLDANSETDVDIMI